MKIYVHYNPDYNTKLKINNEIITSESTIMNLQKICKQMCLLIHTYDL